MHVLANRSQMEVFRKTANLIWTGSGRSCYVAGVRDGYFVLKAAKRQDAELSFTTPIPEKLPNQAWSLPACPTSISVEDDGTLLLKGCDDSSQDEISRLDFALEPPAGSAQSVDRALLKLMQRALDAVEGAPFKDRRKQHYISKLAGGIVAGAESYAMFLRCPVEIDTKYVPQYIVNLPPGAMEVEVSGSDVTIGYEAEPFSLVHRMRQRVIGDDFVGSLVLENTAAPWFSCELGVLEAIANQSAKNRCAITINNGAVFVNGAVAHAIRGHGSAKFDVLPHDLIAAYVGPDVQFRVLEDTERGYMLIKTKEHGDGVVHFVAAIKAN